MTQIPSLYPVEEIAMQLPNGMMAKEVHPDIARFQAHANLTFSKARIL